jgi:hypothetical protein
MTVTPDEPEVEPEGTPTEPAAPATPEPAEGGSDEPER